MNETSTETPAPAGEWKLIGGDDDESVRIYDTTTRLHERNAGADHTGGFCRACANNYTAISAFILTPTPTVETVAGTERECPRSGESHERHHYRYRYTRPGESNVTEGYMLCSGKAIPGRPRS